MTPNQHSSLFANRIRHNGQPWVPMWEAMDRQTELLTRLNDLEEQLDAHQAFLAHVSDWRLDKAIELVRSDLPIEGVMRERLLGRLLNIRDHAEQLEATQKVVTAAQRYLAWRHNWPEAHGGLAELGAALAEYDSNPASESLSHGAPELTLPSRDTN